MSIVSSLSKLLTKMGGTPSTGDNSDELVNKIADAYTPGGGTGILVINGTPGEEDPQHPGQCALTLDKTFEEISAAMPSCILKVALGEGSYSCLNPIITEGLI